MKGLRIGTDTDWVTIRNLGGYLSKTLAEAREVAIYYSLQGVSGRLNAAVWCFHETVELFEKLHGVIDGEIGFATLDSDLIVHITKPVSGPLRGLLEVRDIDAERMIARAEVELDRSALLDFARALRMEFPVPQ